MKKRGEEKKKRKKKKRKKKKRKRKAMDFSMEVWILVWKYGF